MSEGWSYYLESQDQTFELREGELAAGRSRTCDITVNDPSVSRRHVMLKADRGRILLKDLGSSNGTFINGTRVEGGGELHDGDSLGLGDADLKVRIAGVSAFETVRMAAHPLEQEHGDATLFLQQASADLAEEAMGLEQAVEASHMAPPSPLASHTQPPTEPGHGEPLPPKRGHMAPPIPPRQTSPPEIGVEAPAALTPPPSPAPPEPVQPISPVQTVGIELPAPAPPGPSPQPAGIEQRSAEVSPPSRPAPPGPPPQPEAPRQAAAPPAAARPSSSTGVEHPPAVAAPPAPSAPSKPAEPVAAEPAAAEDVRMDQTTGDLLPSLDGFDVTMGPEMMAAIEPKAEEKTAATPAYNPYSAPAAQAQPAAGFGVRLAAMLVDDLWILGVGAGVFFFAVEDKMVASTVACGIGWIVVLFGWAIWGTTPGKRAFNLYVTAGDGAQAGIGFPRALARMVGYLASGLCLGIGFLIIAFRKSRLGLHDIIAGTRVCRQ